ncbi:GRAM domain-containing protein 2B [Blyttiomyces sp. JEL0837]|nr:GRAM domain-containing protein 2B [Blyttiomyces sp. JEL0837]
MTSSSSPSEPNTLVNTTNSSTRPSSPSNRSLKIVDSTTISSSTSSVLNPVNQVQSPMIASPITSFPASPLLQQQTDSGLLLSSSTSDDQHLKAPMPMGGPVTTTTTAEATSSSRYQLGKKAMTAPAEHTKDFMIERGNMVMAPMSNTLPRSNAGNASTLLSPNSSPMNVAHVSIEGATRVVGRHSGSMGSISSSAGGGVGTGYLTTVNEEVKVGTGESDLQLLEDQIDMLDDDVTVDGLARVASQLSVNKNNNNNNGWLSDGYFDSPSSPNGGRSQRRSAPSPTAAAAASANWQQVNDLPMPKDAMNAVNSAKTRTSLALSRGSSGSPGGSTTANNNGYSPASSPVPSNYDNGMVSDDGNASYLPGAGAGMLTEEQSRDERKAIAAKVKATRLMHKVFKGRGLPEDEPLYSEHICACERNQILQQGKMYLTPRFFAFHSNILGYQTDVIIPLQDVTSIDKAKTAIVIPNAIVITTVERPYFFASFLASDSVLK